MAGLEREADTGAEQLGSAADPKQQQQHLVSALVATAAYCVWWRHSFRMLYSNTQSLLTEASDDHPCISRWNVPG